MSPIADFVIHAQELADSGKEPAALVEALQAAGASQIQTVWALKQLGHSLAFANEMVLYHPVWAELRVLNEQIRDEFWGQVEKHADRVEHKDDGQVSCVFDLTKGE